MKNIITIIICMLLPINAQAVESMGDPAQNSRKLMFEVRDLITAGRSDAAHNLLTQAAAQAQNTKKPIERANALAEVGVMFAQAGFVGASRPLFKEALLSMKDAGVTRHQFKGLMDVIIKQRSTGDNIGVRESGLYVMESGILEKMARREETGVVRFVQQLDGIITPEDVLLLTARLREVHRAPFRRHMLEALGNIDYAVSASEMDLRKRLAEEPMAMDAAKNLEQVLWVLLRARLHAAAGEKAIARKLVDDASRQAHQMPNDAERAIALSDKARERL